MYSGAVFVSDALTIIAALLGVKSFSLQNQATFKFRCLLVFVAYCDTGRGKGLALWPSLFTRHSVVVNL